MFMTGRSVAGNTPCEPFPFTVSHGHTYNRYRGGAYWFIVCSCGWRSDARTDASDVLRLGAAHSRDVRS